MRRKPTYPYRQSYRYRRASERKNEIDIRKWYRLFQEFLRKLKADSCSIIVESAIKWTLDKLARLETSPTRGGECLFIFRIHYKRLNQDLQDFRICRIRSRESEFPPTQKESYPILMMSAVVSLSRSLERS